MKFINSNKRIKLSVLPFYIMLSLCSISVCHAANIIADKTAPAGQQADIHIKSQNLSPFPCRSLIGCAETTTINIQSPDANGLSHNKYTKFDAPHFQDIVILNNTLSNEASGNPNLENTVAKIILNEVRSPHASHLAGNIRLSGQDAHVIVANPSGIDCNGCSFTSMSHLTLTTGKAYFSNNKLQGFKIWDGGININKGILNNPGLSHQGRGESTAYLDLFANKLKVKGKLTADDVFVIAGKNRIKLSSPGEKMGVAPLVTYLSTPDYIDSVDVRQMGGMYANKIRIIAEGNIINNKVIESTGLLQMVAEGDIDNAFGGVITGGTVELYSDGIVDNFNGEIKAINSTNTSTINIDAEGLINSEGVIQAHGGKISIILDSPIENDNGNISVIGKTKQLKI
ncbi:filamentous hemagglutinin N-terminal domain-containing protein [Yersinia kristensenii]|uniref:two-partner secretion domain-containing protein n=1 Tax=Yersinia kristensenii TaxID=28152 RepID=UPI001C608136|nr:filamentous hemagglutinin N-terminal domain-containing protein [Yersinia kristensenii]MBW5824486.1 filamentous hemagglutinin N-terminal domain-containing protein [Yersinia kristensenii]